MKTINELVADVKVVLDFYDVVYPTDNDTLLEMEVKAAINEINRCRRFTPSGTTLYDEKYEDKIVPLVTASFLKSGAEGETSHSENGIVRNYENGGKYPSSLLADIVPLAKMN